MINAFSILPSFVFNLSSEYPDVISPVARISPVFPDGFVPTPIDENLTLLFAAKFCVIMYGNTFASNVPEVILFAFVVSIVAEFAKPETAEEEIAIATLDALVILPYPSTINDGTELAVPYPVAETPELGNLPAGNVPDVILFALVVSVVADVAKPETAETLIAIATFAAFVILPKESTTNEGIELGVP